MEKEICQKSPVALNTFSAISHVVPHIAFARPQGVWKRTPFPDKPRNRRQLANKRGGLLFRPT